MLPVRKASSGEGGYSPKLAGPLVGLGIAVASFLLYLRTLAPTVLSRIPEEGLYDAGLLQVRAYILGISHPTGYPTYLLLAKLFTYLPVGDIAYRVNLASAVYAAATVFVLFLVCRRLTGGLLPAAAAALLFGVSRAFWHQAVITEVYTLNTLFIVLIIFVLLRWRDNRRDRYLLLFALLMGLSLTNHLTSGLLLPVGLLFIWLTDRRKLSLTAHRLLLKGAGLFTLGLLPYLYLPLRASKNPPFTAHALDTVGELLAFVTGRAFGNQMFIFGPVELVGRFGMYLHHLSQQFHPVLLVISAVGLSRLFYRDRTAFVMLGFLYLGWLLYALEYNIIDVRVYFIPTYLILAVFFAAGVAALAEAVRRHAAILITPQARPVIPTLGALAILAPLAMVPVNYGVVDRSASYEAREAIEAVATDVERGATVITNGSSMWYMRLVEERRTDIELVSPFLETGTWSSREEQWSRFTKKHMSRGGPVYIVDPGDVEP